MPSQQKKNTSLRLTLTLCAIALATSCATARINPVKSVHPAGSIGYLQDSCNSALKNSTSFEEFNSTYCGDFLRGFSLGALQANWIIFSYGPNEDCLPEKKAAADIIDNRFCKIFANKKTIILWNDQEFYPATMVKYLNGWVAALEQSYPNKRIFDAPITYANQLSYKAINCDVLQTSIQEQEEKPLEINDALQKVDWKAYFKGKEMLSAGRRSNKESYLGCKNDLEIAKSNPEKFKATSCGAEILGYMTGLLTTDHLDNHPPIQGNCKKTIEDLYASMVVAKRSCIRPDTNPVKIAEIFIRNTDRKWNMDFVAPETRKYPDQKSLNDAIEKFTSQPVIIAEGALLANSEWKSNMCLANDN